MRRVCVRSFQRRRKSTYINLIIDSKNDFCEIHIESFNRYPSWNNRRPKNRSSMFGMAKPLNTLRAETHTHRHSLFIRYKFYWGLNAKCLRYSQYSLEMGFFSRTKNYGMETVRGNDRFYWIFDGIYTYSITDALFEWLAVIDFE